MSEALLLRDTIFQGTVLGPPLWNRFFSDVKAAVRKAEFTEAVFADDLSCFKVFHGRIGDSYIFTRMQTCQSYVHAWGVANQVVSHAGKEGLYILNGRRPSNDHFKLLSVIFDTRLTMHSAIQKLTVEDGWRLKALLRTRRFYNTVSMVRLYKCQVLAFLGATAAIYHATLSLLRRLDQIQIDFLDSISSSQDTALVDINLAPLCARRDI